MNAKTFGRVTFLSVIILMASAGARAQIAVIDYSSFGQLIQQVQATQQVLTNARNQLAQAQSALQTMTGTRGMQLLLGGITRNYLPTDWQQLSGSLQSLGASYPALASSVTSLLAANAILPPAVVSSLSASDQQRLQANRYQVAMNQSIARGALANASARFGDLQSLINTIGSATDQKSILDLQARIGAELSMLQNEQTKLQSLAQVAQAQDAAAREQLLEQVVAAHGQFPSRFQPTP